MGHCWGARWNTWQYAVSIVQEHKYIKLTALLNGIYNCYDCNKSYKSNSERVEIYNIASPYADDPVFEQLAINLFLTPAPAPPPVGDNTW